MNTTTSVDSAATSNQALEARRSAVIVPINTDSSVAPTQPSDDQTLVPSMPDCVPSLDDFSFMSPAPETIHVYYSERSRPLFGILRVPDENDVMRRQAIAFGRRGGKERWHLVSEDEAYEIVRKANGGNIPLYRLDKLTSQPDAPVICMLDEYAADIVQEALPDHVVVAVRAKTCIEPLLARDVAIWPNAGEAGINEAMDVAADIKKCKYMTGECGGKVSGIDLPDDLPDWWNPGVSDPADLGIDIVSLVQRPVPPEQAFRPFTIMPDGYKMKKNGLVFIGEDGVDRQVTLTPFDVVAETDLAERGDSGLILRWQNRGQQVEHVVQRGQISARGSTLLKDLRAKKMLFPETVMKLLLDFLGTVEARRFVRTVSTVGWDNVAGWDRPRFVMPGGELIGGSGASEIRFAAPHVNTEGERLKYVSSGTLQEWQNHVASRSAGNSRLILGICLALTSPLLKVLGNVIEAGGVHIWGDAGLGKSTYSNVVTSVWGNPAKLMIELDGTKTGFENAAELASCIGLFLEELKNEDTGVNKEIGRIIYMWANRKGGLRSGPSIALRETKEFDIMFCSTGEHHLKTVIEKSGGTYTGGIEARMTSIRAGVDGSPYGLPDTIHDAPSSKSFVDQMKADCEKYHGTAGRHFVAKLIEDISEKGRDDIRDWFNQYIEAFIKEYVPSGADRAINRVATRFAVFAAVGELAREYGTLPWDAGEAFKGVGACFMSWIDDRGGIGSREEINAVQIVRKFISMHRFTRFEDIVAARTAKEGADCYLSNVRDRVGYREAVRTKDGDDAYAYYITVEGWDEICKGIDPARAAKAVLAAGALQPPKQGRGLTIQKRLPHDGKIRVYVITPEIMTAGGPVEDDQESE